MLKAIFYARFHTERGPSVIHQYPAGSIRSTRQQHQPPLLSWSDISSYIIPPYDLCNRAVSICTNGHRVLAFPVSLEDPRYDRNRFTFNAGFVLAEEEDARPWEQVVRKTAHFLTMLEEQDGLLQAEEKLAGLKWAGEEEEEEKEGSGDPRQHGVGIVRDLLERILEDLNAYGETCARIDRLHVLNLRLENDGDAATTRMVRSWDVPLLIRTLPTPEQWTWDLTLQRIHVHLDGIKHVQKIAELADVELKLVRTAVRELVYHGHAILLDIFHFQAIYACTDHISFFMQSTEMQDECRRYIAIPFTVTTTTSSSSKTVTLEGTKATTTAKTTSSGKEQQRSAATIIPAREDVMELYCLLQPGIKLSEFCTTHKTRLTNIDIRRFITFGTIKGFVRRVHKYALALKQPFSSSFPVAVASSSKKPSSGPNSSHHSSKPKSNDGPVKEFERAWRKAALSSGWATPPLEPPLPPLPPPPSQLNSHKSAELVTFEEEGEKLAGFLDGNHCMDQICVAMHWSESKVLERLRSGRFGEVILFNR